MKVIVALITACALVVLSAGMARADELSDLKKQLELLQQKLEALEKQQAEQAKEVKKVSGLSKSVESLKKQPSAKDVVADALGKQTTIGGHFRLFLADYATGERNGNDTHNSVSAGVSDLWLYFNKKMNNWLQFTVAPRIGVTASATPRLGSYLTRQSSAEVGITLDEAYMNVQLPSPFDVQIKAGAIYPMFSEDYAAQNWWHEQYHGNNGLMRLQAWRSTGLELYRNFDFDSFSMPVYFYPYINRSDWSFNQPLTDNNSSKDVLIHVAPEFFLFGGRVKLLGSFGMGKWDDAGEYESRHWLGGLDLVYGSLTLTGEYMERWRENLALTGGGKEDGEDKGWYIRANYSITPEWRVLVKYSDVDLYKAGSSSLLTDNYKTLSVALNIWLASGSTLIPQLELVDAERSDASEKLEYLRYTLGWRTTF
ncbi:MAG: hypothetical protein Q8P24_15715 [Desulfobacterales bacterium]|nr:hypothetical protein [Desulfobacterales bacterium]